MPVFLFRESVASGLSPTTCGKIEEGASYREVCFRRKNSVCEQAKSSASDAEPDGRILKSSATLRGYAHSPTISVIFSFTLRS